MLKPGEAKAYYWKGFTYGEQGKLEDAENAYTKALYYDPYYVEAFFARGNIRYSRVN
jgi:tetratricopeptide (TPR) repeat protein